MTTGQLFPLEGFAVVNAADENEITGVYCADLLSWAMGRAPEGSAWCTVMGNVNAVAVAALADVAVLVLCEGAEFDAPAKEKAQQQGIFLVKTQLPAFKAGLAIGKKLGLHGL